MPSRLFRGKFDELPTELLLDGTLTRAAVRTDHALVVFNCVNPAAYAPHITTTHSIN